MKYYAIKLYMKSNKSRLGISHRVPILPLKRKYKIIYEFAILALEIQVLAVQLN